MVMVNGHTFAATSWTETLSTHVQLFFTMIMQSGINYLGKKNPNLQERDKYGSFTKRTLSLGSNYHYMNVCNFHLPLLIYFSGGLRTGSDDVSRDWRS